MSMSFEEPESEEICVASAVAAADNAAEDGFGPVFTRGIFAGACTH